MTGELKTLNDAFVASKKERQVLSKQIIWESGISKSQFYRILSGKETPSPETKARISTALKIDTAEFDRLHAQSHTELQDNMLPPKTKPSLLPIFSVASILVIGGLALFTLTQQDQNEPVAERNITHSDDSTLFIKDVTIPDGTSIPVDTTFVKTWRVKNTGKVVWKNRYLKRVTTQSNQVCSSPAMVPIPETAPGEIIDISVTFTTPHLPGSCRTDWKSADEHGHFHFPDMHGLFSIVTVVE